MRGELLKVPQKDRVKFGTHFLNSVHCQLTIPPLAADNIVNNGKVIKECLDFLNLDDPTQMREGSWRFEAPSTPDKAPQLHSETQEVTGLRFLSKSPRVDVAISKTSILYSEYEYSGFDNFSDNLLKMVRCVAPILNIEKASCIGLRKINSILVGPVTSLDDALSAFNSELFGTAKSGIADTQAIKAFEGSLAMSKNGYACLLRHSLRNLEKEDRFEVQLDFDLVDQNERELDSDFSHVLENLNNTSFDLFSWSVSDVLTRIMDPIAASGKEEN